VNLTDRGIAIVSPAGQIGHAPRRRYDEQKKKARYVRKTTPHAIDPIHPENSNLDGILSGHDRVFNISLGIVIDHMVCRSPLFRLGDARMGTRSE
jgi:hypothetical protein